MERIVNKKKDDELNRITVGANAGDHGAIPTASNAGVAIIIANELNAPGTLVQAVASTSQNHGEPSKVIQGVESHGDKVFKCCPDGFCEMVGRHKARNVELSERESELRQRLATLECWIPAVTLIKMLTGEVDSSNIYNLIDEQAMTMSESNAHLHTSLSQHKDTRIRDIEAQRKEAHRRLEEARKLLREKQSAVDERAKQIEEAQRKQMSLEQKIGQLQERFERDGIDLMKVTSTESIASFGSEDLASIIKLEELVTAEEHTKRQLEELERREETYMKTLQAAGNIIPRDKKHPEIDELRGQLEVKSAANQQMADRICLLEDQVENLKGKLARCKDHVDQQTASHSKQRTITNYGRAGVYENGEKKVDKAILATTITVSSAAGSEHDIVDRDERGVLATVRTDSKETLTRVELAERSVQGAINTDGNRSIGQITKDSTQNLPTRLLIIEAGPSKTPEQLPAIAQGRLSPLYEDTSISSVDTDSSEQYQRQYQSLPPQHRSNVIQSTGYIMASEDPGDDMGEVEENEGYLPPRQDGAGSVRFAQANAAHIPPGENRDMRGAWRNGQNESFHSLRSQNDESSGCGTFINAAAQPQVARPRATTSPGRRDEIAHPDQMEQIVLTRRQLEMWLANVTDIRRQISSCRACQAKQQTLVMMCIELCHHLRLQPNLCIEENAIASARAPIAHREDHDHSRDELSIGPPTASSTRIQSDNSRSPEHRVVSRIHDDTGPALPDIDNDGQPARRHASLSGADEPPYRDVSRIDYDTDQVLPDVDNANQHTRIGEYTHSDAIRYDTESTVADIDNADQPVRRRQHLQRNDEELPLREVSRINYDANSTVSDHENAVPSAVREHRSGQHGELSLREISRIDYDANLTESDHENARRAQRSRPDNASQFRDVSRIRYDNDSTLSDANHSGRSERRGQERLPDDAAHQAGEAFQLIDESKFPNINDPRQSPKRNEQHQPNDAHDLAKFQAAQADPHDLGLNVQGQGQHKPARQAGLGRQIGIAAMELAIWRESISDIRRYISRCPICRAKRRALGAMCKAICEHLQIPLEHCEDDDEPAEMRMAVVPRRRRDSTIQEAIGHDERTPPRQVEHGHCQSETFARQQTQLTDTPVSHPIPGTAYATTPRRRPPSRQSPRSVVPRKLFDSGSGGQSPFHVDDSTHYENPPVMDLIPCLPYGAYTPRRTPPIRHSPRASAPQELHDPSVMLVSSRRTHSQVNDSTIYEEPPVIDSIPGAAYAASTPRRRQPSRHSPHSGVGRRVFDYVSVLESSGQSPSQVTDSTGYEELPAMDPIVGAPYAASEPRRRPQTRQSPPAGVGRNLFDSGNATESNRNMHSTHPSIQTTGQDSQLADATYHIEPANIDPIIDAPFGSSTPIRRQPKPHSPRMKPVRLMHTSIDTGYSSPRDHDYDSILESSRGIHSVEQSNATSGYDSRLTESTYDDEPPNMNPITGAPYGTSTLTRRQRSGQSPHSRTIDGQSPRQRSHSPNKQHYDTQGSLQYSETSGIDSAYYQEFPGIDSITSSPIGGSTPKRRKRMEQSRQTQSTRDSTMNDEDTGVLDESSQMTYGKGARQQFDMDEMRGEFTSRKDYTGTSIGPIMRRKIDKGKSFNESNDRKIPVLDELSDSQDQVFHGELSLPYVSSDSESQRDSRSENDEKRARWKMEKRKYVLRPISREQSKKKSEKVEKEGREHHKRSRKKEISDMERSSVFGPSTSHVQSNRQRSCCICPFAQIPRSEHERSMAFSNNCRPCPTEYRSNKTKRDDSKDGKLITMSSMKTQTAARHRDVNSKHSPDFDCEVCDCEPCGTPSSYYSSPGKARVNVATNVSPRATKRMRNTSAKKARTNG